VFVPGVFQKLFSSVSSVYCICCNDYIRMLQVYVLNILDVCFTCFILMFHVFHLDISCVLFYLDVAKGSDVAYVAMATHIYFKCMFHMFYLF
jgi:hypothetical protein